MSRAKLTTISLFVALAIVVGLVPIPVSAKPVTRQITMTADQFAFDPPVLKVNQGDRVRLTLHAADVVHGFYLDAYGLKTRVEPGVSQQIEFVANQTGKFRYRCSVSCGSLHPFMIGELVVSPNWPFARSVGLLLVAVVGTLVYLRRFPPRPE
jgi:heme/copper-type cytochrome/quinol oxidase subunit 2